MQEELNLQDLQDYGYCLTEGWKTRMLSLVDAVMDIGILRVIKIVEEKGQKRDAKDLKIFFPLSEEELQENYKDGIPYILRMMEYTEEQHKEMARKVIKDYSTWLMPKNKKQKITVEDENLYISETDLENQRKMSSEEETIEIIPIIPEENEFLLDPMPTEEELNQTAEFLIYDTHEKMIGMFSRFIEQFQDKEIQAIMKQKISGYLNEFIEYKSYCIFLTYEEVTQKLKEVLHEEEKEFYKEEQTMLETVKYLSCQRNNEGIEHAKNIAKKRRKCLLELKKLDNGCFRKFKKEYKEKYDFYMKKKEEKIMEIQDFERKIKDLERQIESVKGHKSMLRKELNLKELHFCNNTLRKIYKKIYDCYANTDILWYERYNYEVLAIGVDMVDPIYPIYPVDPISTE